MEKTQGPIQMGTHFLIKGRKVKGKDILVGRTMEFTGYSKKEGMVNGFLTHKKSGKLQKTEISIPSELLEEIPSQIQIQQVG